MCANRLIENSKLLVKPRSPFKPPATVPVLFAHSLKTLSISFESKPMVVSWQLMLGHNTAGQKRKDPSVAEIYKSFSLRVESVAIERAP